MQKQCIAIMKLLVLQVRAKRCNPLSRWLFAVEKYLTSLRFSDEEDDRYGWRMITKQLEASCSLTSKALSIDFDSKSMVYLPNFLRQYRWKRHILKRRKVRRKWYLPLVYMQSSHFQSSKDLCIRLLSRRYEDPSLGWDWQLQRKGLSVLDRNHHCSENGPLITLTRKRSASNGSQTPPSNSIFSSYSLISSSIAMASAPSPSQRHAHHTQSAIQVLHLCR